MLKSTISPFKIYSRKRASALCKTNAMTQNLVEDLSPTTMVNIYLAKMPSGLIANTEHLHRNQCIKARSFTGKRLTEFIIARLLIQHALGSNWEILEREGQGPIALCATHHTTLKLSVSHSNGWIGVAIASPAVGLEIGLDIERVHSNWSAEKAAFFCNREQVNAGLALAKTSDRDHFFTSLWTHKEAYFKATQKPFVEKDFCNDARMHTHIIDDNMILSVFTDAISSIAINHVIITSEAGKLDLRSRLKHKATH